jgi:predicted RNase H-like nuclease (RuvC/YqgF family)
VENAQASICTNPHEPASGSGSLALETELTRLREENETLQRRLKAIEAERQYLSAACGQLKRLERILTAS